MIEPETFAKPALMELAADIAEHALDTMVATIEQVGGDDARDKMAVLSMAMARVVMSCAEMDEEAALDALRLLVAWAEGKQL